MREQPGATPKPCRRFVQRIQGFDFKEEPKTSSRGRLSISRSRRRQTYKAATLSGRPFLAIPVLPAPIMPVFHFPVADVA